MTSSHANISMFQANHNFFKKFFFTIYHYWMDPNLRKSDTYRTFKITILRPSPNSVFQILYNNVCHNPQRIKFFTRLGLGLSHLPEHKFKYSFQDSLNPFCNCGIKNEWTSHFLLHSPIYNNDWSSHLSAITNIDCKLLDNTGSHLTQTLLYENSSLDIITYSLIVNTTWDLILSIKRLKAAFFKDIIRVLFPVPVCFLIINQ